MGRGGFTTIALGNTLTVNATEATFSSTVFGNSSTFTVGPGGETVYAAVYQKLGTVGNDPIAFIDSAGSTYLAFPTALVPVVGQDISAANENTFAREYAFSITLTPLSSFVLAALAQSDCSPPLVADAKPSDRTGHSKLQTAQPLLGRFFFARGSGRSG